MSNASVLHAYSTGYKGYSLCVFMLLSQLNAGFQSDVLHKQGCGCAMKLVRKLADLLLG
jgi:hypothetical protein